MAFQLNDISNFGGLSFYSANIGTGPTGSIGYTGATGATGCTGPSNILIPNGAFGTEAGDYFPVNISDTYVPIASTFITTLQPCKLWSLTTAVIQNSDNNKPYTISTFVTLDSVSSFVTNMDIPPRLANATPSTTPLTITQTSPIEPAGIYKSVLYARTTAPATTVSCTHCDMFIMGNLA